jgi:hypothetical protein
VELPLRSIVSHLQHGNKRLFEGLIWFHSPGHMVLEGDYIARVMSRDVKEFGRGVLFVEDKAPALFLKKALEFSEIPIDILLTENAFKIQREIAIFFPELTIEGGIWSFKIPGYSSPRGEYDFNFLHTRSYEEILSFHRRAYSLRDCEIPINVYKNYYENKVLLDPKNRELVEILFGKRYAVVQLKNVAWNSVSALQTEPFYRNVLGHLRDNSITPVVIGRDPPPSYFSEFNAIDYTRSKFVSYESDWILIGLSTIGLVHASGLHNIFDVLSKSYVYHDSWHHWPTKSNACLFVPSAILKEGSDQPLAFPEFVKMARIGYDLSRGGFVFPSHLGYSARPADARVVMSAVSELLQPEAASRSLEKSRAKEIIRSYDTDNIWSVTDTSIPIDILTQSGFPPSG